MGYFFLSGLTPIAEKLDKVKELRLLIGNTTNRETLEQLAEGYQRLELVAEAAEAQAYPKRTETEKMAAETAANVRTSVELMDQTDEGEALVKNLARMIEEKRLVVWYDGEGAIPHPRSGCIGWPWATPTGPDPKERADPAGVETPDSAHRGACNPCVARRYVLRPFQGRARARGTRHLTLHKLLRHVRSPEII